MRCICDFIVTFAPQLEDWQSDRMRWTRNPVYPLSGIGGLNPSSSASNLAKPKGKLRWQQTVIAVKQTFYSDLFLG